MLWNTFSRNKQEKCNSLKHTASRSPATFFITTHILFHYFQFQNYFNPQSDASYVSLIINSRFLNLYNDNYRNRSLQRIEIETGYEILLVTANIGIHIILINSCKSNRSFQPGIYKSSQHFLYIPLVNLLQLIPPDGKFHPKASFLIQSLMRRRQMYWRRHLIECVTRCD